MLTSRKKLLIMHFIVVAFSVFHASRSEKPIIVKRPTSQNVYVNQSATFVCRVQSTLPFTIEWTKDGARQILKTVPGFLLVLNDSLTFLHARRRDTGIYKCTVYNNEGSSSSEATLTVLDPPVAPNIVEISTNQTIVEGGRVTFTCKANGNPLPQITWKIFLKSGDDNAAHLERPSPQSIHISSATPRDAGQYVCIAENDLGNDTKTVYLNVLGYPNFIVSPPSNITISENKTVNLNCKVIGSPVPDVNWYYGNKLANEISNIVVLDNNTMQISNVKFDNSGSYTCMANNSLGLQSSRNTLIQVLQKPKLDCCPNKMTEWRNQTAIKGQLISLDCSSTGYPELDYQWMFENKSVSSFSVFTISNVSTQDDGIYSCMVRNNLGVVMLIVYLNVLVPPEVSVHPQEAIVVNGEYVEFSCSATGVPLPLITWYSSKGLVLRNNTLVITNVSNDDQGEYICEAKNKAGLKTVRTRVTIAVPPTFLILPRNISVNETSSVNIQCTAEGPDKPIISWYRLMTNGQKINLNLSSNGLIITKVDRNDNGFYVCEAKNYAGYINATFFINVLYPPYLLISEQNVSIIAGAHTILRCPVNANPAAEIQWINPVWFHGPRLTITKVNISHGGRYSCRGKNVLGTIDASLQVQVMTPPYIVDLKLVNLLNNFTLISCVTIGTPASIVHWIDLAQLPKDYFNVHDGNLVIEKRYINNMKFLCNASNAYGWMTKYVAVPSSPYNFITIKKTSSSVKFSWLTKDSEIISNFIVERRSISPAISDWVTINFSVMSSLFEDRNLPPFTMFLYRVSANNVLGTSKPGGSFNVTTKEGVPSFPSELEAKSRSLTSITVQWKPPREPRGQLTSIMYEMYYKESADSPKNEVNITVGTMKDRIRIQKLKSNTLYIIKMRAGRQIDGSLKWSDYRWLRVRTLQEAPNTAPKEIKAVSNGPRKIYVTWKKSRTYVEGYKLQYKEYDSINITTIVQIKSWNTSSYMITGLTASRYYEIQLNMFTSGGDGPWSHPKVVHTETDRLALPCPIDNSSDSLLWKIAVGGSVLAVILLLLLLLYIYLMRKSSHKKRSDTKRTKKKSRTHGRYDFTDNISAVSNESESSTKGVYNVNVVNDHIGDLSMFDNSHHSNVSSENMYIENPILPTQDEIVLTQDDSDDSYEAVRLATFIARPSPHPTPHLTGRRQQSASHVNPAYHSDEDDDMYSKADRQKAMTKTRQTVEDSNIPVYAQIDFAKKERDKKTSEQLSDDILI